MQYKRVTMKYLSMIQILNEYPVLATESNNEINEIRNCYIVGLNFYRIKILNN